MTSSNARSQLGKFVCANACFGNMIGRGKTFSWEVVRHIAEISSHAKKFAK